jgi:hypothetical protein
MAANSDHFDMQRASSIEKELIQDSRITLEKVDEIFRAGVSLEEYFQYPWLEKQLSEKDWLQQRRAGIITEDEMSTRQIKKKEWTVVQNFFVPGMHQFKRGQSKKGFLMLGIALGTMALYAFHHDPNESNNIGFDYHGYLALLGADLLWSSIDIGVQVQRELNQDANRFSMISNKQFNTFNYLPFSGRTESYVTHVSQW